MYGATGLNLRASDVTVCLWNRCRISDGGGEENKVNSDKQSSDLTKGSGPKHGTVKNSLRKSISQQQNRKLIWKMNMDRPNSHNKRGKVVA